MIYWRDVRSHEEMTEFLEEFHALPWTEKQPILEEMTELLISEKEMNQPSRIFPKLDQDPPLRKKRRPRRRR